MPGVCAGFFYRRRAGLRGAVRSCRTEAGNGRARFDLCEKVGSDETPRRCEAIFVCTEILKGKAIGLLVAVGLPALHKADVDLVEGLVGNMWLWVGLWLNIRATLPGAVSQGESSCGGRG